MFVPVMSAGIRSGVNWMRLNSRSRASASVRTSIVLPSPGTPSSKAWPPAMRQINTSRTTPDWPTMTVATSFSMRETTARNSETAIGGAGVSVMVTMGFPGEVERGRAIPSAQRPEDDDECNHEHDDDESDGDPSDGRDLHASAVSRRPGAEAGPRIAQRRD